MTDDRTVRTEIVIDAPHEVVWKVLTDFPRYPEWNPFTVSVETRGRVGDPVVMDVRLGGSRKTMHERMDVNEPPRRIGWGLHVLFGVLVDCTRVQELVPLPDGRTRYECHESFRGLLTPVILWAYRDAMQQGFDAAARALKQRVESRTAMPTPERAS